MGDTVRKMMLTLKMDWGLIDSYGDTPVCEAAGTESLITPVQR